MTAKGKIIIVVIQYVFVTEQPEHKQGKVGKEEMCGRFTRRGKKSKQEKGD